MHSMGLWPFLTLAAVGLASVPTIEDSGQRAMAYWLVIPPLLAGAFVACSHFWVS